MKPTNKHNIQLLNDIPRENNFKLPKDYFKTVEEIISSTVYLQQKHTSDSKIMSVPNGYFDSIETSIVSKLKEEEVEETKKQALSNTIPTDYFETLEDRVFKRLPKPKRITPFKKVLKTAFAPIAIAASLLLIVTLGNLHKANPISTFDTISSNDIEAWIASGDLFFDTEDFTELITDKTLEFDTFSNIYTDEQAMEFLGETDLENILFEE